jgi:hypothetical protein
MFRILIIFAIGNIYREGNIHIGEERRWFVVGRVSNINRSVRTSFSGPYDDGRRVCAIGGRRDTL